MGNPYAYIEQRYGLAFKVGERVEFVEEGCARREGVVRRPFSSAEHYVAVLFNGARDRVPCHPTSLKSLSPPQTVAPGHNGGSEQ